MNSWYKNIQHIEECTGDVHAVHALTSGICSRLTTLRLTDRYRITTDELLNLLVNAPSLKSLALPNFYLGFEGFELLHENVPSLSSLELYTTEISEAHLSLSSIKPAPLMITLSICSPGGNAISLHQYCCQKYPNLTDFPTFLMPLVHNEEEEFETSHTSVMGSFGPNLKSYSLSINYTESYVFKMIDENGCRISKFTLNTVGEGPMIQLSLSNQVNYITKLTIKYLEILSSLEYLKKFLALKDLELFGSTFDDYSNQYHKINLDEILIHARNTLKSITLCGCSVGTSSSTENNIRYHSLKSITLGFTTFRTGIDKYISQSLPKLHNLDIYHCTRKCPTFILPTSNLTTFRFMHSLDTSAKRIDWNHRKLLVKTLCNNEERWHSLQYNRPPKNFLRTIGLWSTYDQALFDISDMAPYPTLASLRSDKLHNESHMKFVCNSVQDAYIM